MYKTYYDINSSNLCKVKRQILAQKAIFLSPLFEGRKCLFNDALNTFYLRVHSVGHMVKREEIRSRHMVYSFRLAPRVRLYAPFRRQDKHTTAFVTPVVDHWLKREIAQWVHHEGRSNDPSHHSFSCFSLFEDSFEHNILTII